MPTACFPVSSSLNRNPLFGAPPANSGTFAPLRPSLTKRTFSIADGLVAMSLAHTDHCSTQASKKPNNKECREPK